MPNNFQNGFSQNGSKPKKQKGQKEWTLMFLFASDNPLAPGIVSQLKAIKNAGYHPDVNVIAQFDPHTKGVPVHIFDVNMINKLNPDASRIGSGESPWVNNLVLDKLWGDSEHDKARRKSIKDFLEAEIQDGENGEVEVAASFRKNKPSSAKEKSRQARSDAVGLNDLLSDYDPPVPPTETSGEQTPEDALTTFLNFCREEYPARHYVLFILGHGVVVGNDMFLFDEDAKEHSLTLKKLGAVLGDFTRKLPSTEAFELISFHSCSMSSLEVAYELRGTAKYMIASQSTAFVGSWAYTPIVMRILKDAKGHAKSQTKETAATIRKKMNQIFDYCFYNSYDFMLAGYSFNIALSDLTKASSVTKPLQTLTAQLTKCLDNEQAMQLIVLAHLEAQSFYHESYTDLSDFCSCLLRKCGQLKAPSADLKVLISACEEVIEELAQDRNKLVLRTRFLGPSVQYSNGLSVYFPWSEPRPGEFFSKDYPAYVFEETGWHEFLKAYFEKTKRKPVQIEAEAAERPFVVPKLGSVEDSLEQITVVADNESGQLGKGSGSDATGDPPSKGSGSDPTGGDCACLSIKNYPSFTFARGEECAGEVKTNGTKSGTTNGTKAGAKRAGRSNKARKKPA